MGSVRVGIAISDPSGVLATPVATLDRDARDGNDLDAIRGLVIDREVVEVVVGLPRTLRGTIGPAADAARNYGTLLAQRISPIPVVYSDERFTSVTANQVLAGNGVRSRARRSVVDQVAAVAILQGHLDRQRLDRERIDRQRLDRQVPDPKGLGAQALDGQVRGARP